uniref:Uncharacterized protein n=1 Tax=Megaselia scalaris TaxID=36166 RepID=T1GUP1_MEGSC
MYNLKKILFFAIFSIAFSQISANCVSQCKQTKENISVKVANLKYNSPRNDEIVRLKLFYKEFYSPLVIRSSGKNVTFGTYQTAKKWGLYKRFEDYNVDSPCTFTDSSPVFNEKSFLKEVTIVLEKSGLFFVVISGDEDLIMSCNTGFEFWASADDNIHIAAYSPILYDCPI